MRVKLKDVVDMLEFQVDEQWPRLDLETGEVVLVSGDLAGAVEADEEEEEAVSDRVGEQLERALQGKGAFRYFKDSIRRLGVEQEWYAYRTGALQEIARKWGAELGVEWV